MKLLILLLITVFSCNCLFGQQNISGHIIDEKGQPVAFASVSLLNANDLKIIRVIAANQDGFYQFVKTDPGFYKISASAIGYQLLTSAPVKLQNTNIVIDKIQLLPDTKQLAGIVVTGKKPFFEQHADKLIVNVQNSILSSGVTAAEILRRVPGVRILNDKITMTGKNKVMIMVDGRLSQYQDMNALLRATPSSNIDRIEVISNPSAGYDAEGDGIINIILKKKEIAGTNGSAGFATGGSFYRLDEVTQGSQFYHRYNPSLSVNHQSGRFNLFGSYDYIYRNQFEVNLINRVKDNSFYDQRNYNPSAYGTHTYQAGINFKPDTLNTFGLLISGFNRKGTGNYLNNSTQQNTANGQTTDAFTSENQQQNRNNNLTLNLNWRHTFAHSKQSLAVDANVAHYLLKNSSGIKILSENNNPVTIYQQINNPINFETVKADYIYPFSQKSRLETGAKTSFAKIDNDLLFQQNGIADTARSNDFIYHENINAAYINFNTSFQKWDLQLGIRTEQTVAKGKSGDKQVLKRNYIQGFPSVTLTRHLDSVLAITGQYSRRIGRPSYQQQNPFEVYLDPLTYTKGNPLLYPQTTNLAKLSLTYTGLPFFTLAYDQTDHVIVEYAPQQKTITDANGVARLVSFSVADNLAKAKTFSSQLNFPLKAGSVVDGYGGLITTLQRYHAFYQGADFNASKWNFTFFIQEDFKFSASWSGQLSAYYATPSQYEFIRAGKNSSVDAGVSKKVFRNRGKIALSCSDLYFGDKTLGKINYQDINLKLKQYNDTRNIILAFTYSFGSQHIKDAETHHSGSEEESNRIKTN